MAESKILKEIQLTVGSRADARIFRNNVGGLKAEDGRFVTFGLCPGSSDLIGLISKEITLDMVGQRVAIFTAIETKDSKKPAKASADQVKFIDMINRMGGIAGVCRSVEDAKELLCL